ncbi:dUTP diphosphatase [Peribacillus alkalitolerans]|uniref:dUTP diphosphatase n=1 Tax=Peribacillus alkalitolerans TaxID=1550385 RepID=UPI0013D82431|nr:dUTP diphosphatase [Peribacillus alkalitolerans]
MDYNQLFKMQKALDTHIEEKHGLLEVDLIEKKILAFLVELGELANETRCFKFWSIKESSPKQKILEEYVDGVHFILSLGIDLGLDDSLEDLHKTTVERSITDQFLRVFEVTMSFKSEKVQATYHELFTQYILLGELLGFSQKEVKEAYIEKNRVNFERQEQGY